MNKEFLFEMLKTGSVSGNEVPLQKKCMEFMKDTAEKVMTDETGDVTHVINPDSPIKIMLSGHIDEIGLMITHVLDNGMLKVASVGGIRTAMYLGHKVRIYTKKGIVYGAVLCNSSLMKNKELKASDLSIDIGASTKEEALAVVELGDTITIDEDVRELLNERITARAMDNRIGAFIVLEALRRAKEKGCKVGLYSTTSCGEETTMRGAYWASSRIEPTCAIAVDVTFATDYQGTDPAETGDVRIGKGPVLCNSTICSKTMNRILREAAAALDMNVQTEAAVGRTGTDADKIHFSNKGVPTALVSIPLRYMHCHDEVGSLNDIHDCIELLAEFACRMSEAISLNPYEE